jgi:hypothetical protein
MTDDACEAGYRGAVVREGKEGTREGLEADVRRVPGKPRRSDRAKELGNYVCCMSAWRSKASEPFDVIAVYSFEGDKVARVEFIR